MVLKRLSLKKVYNEAVDSIKQNQTAHSCKHFLHFGFASGHNT